MTVKEPDIPPVWKLLIVSSFIMLSMLTWAASPIQRLVERVQKKETLKAQVKVCRHIESMQAPYEKYVKDMFISGCMWTSREVMKSLNPDKKDYYKKLFEDQEDLEFDKFLDNCSGGAAGYQKEGKIKEMLVSNLYHDLLKCKEVYTKADNIGLKEEDVQ